MKIENNKVVTLTYDLRKDSHEGDNVETADKENPLKFIYGVGMMLPSFEKQIDGMSTEGDFQFKLEAKEAYGEYEPKKVSEIPIKAFEIDGKIEDGLLVENNIIPLQDPDGNQFNGIVKELKENDVVMDFNHPMAGQDLYFTGKIVEVRDATKEEIEHGHVH